MLRVIPLGGLGEIGLNTMVLEHHDERILIDCGLMFPRADQLGVDVVLPDFSWVREAPDSLKAIVLTHAHEDHLGALPWFLRELNVPVYGTRFTLAVARHKLDEAGVRADLREIEPRHPVRIGQQFTVEPIRVTHSVPDAVALAVTTSSGTLIHTGDFKLDGMPVDGQLTDLERFEELGAEGVSVLLSDSTNAEVPGTTGSEMLVRETFDRLFTQATSGRIVVAMFGSHLHRVRTAFELAKQHRRRVLLAGRSLQRNVELAKQAGILPVPEGLLFNWDTAGEVPRERQLVLCTGAQAEPQAALTKMLGHDPGAMRLEAGDTVILSSRTIPGNEQGVAGLLNRLFARGAKVIYAGIEPGVHVSGHASQDEQRRMIDAVTPKHFVPIHGELRHLHRHRDLARRSGIGDEHSFIMTDGDAMGFSMAEARHFGRVPNGQVLTRRDSYGTVTEAALNERRALAEAGLVIVIVAMARGGSELLSGPTVHAQGLQGDELSALSLAAEGARLALSEITAGLRADDERVREELTRGVRRVFKQLLGTRPNVLPLVMRIAR